MIRNMRGTIEPSQRPAIESRAATGANSLDRRDSLRSRERRTPRVPDEMIGRESPRLLPDNTAGIATWLDAREPVAEKT
jgi:hypothetical protein